MKAIRLPAGTSFVRFDELPRLLAEALHPEAAEDAENLDAAIAELTYESGDLRRAVDSGELVVKNPLTKLPLSFTVGHALNRGVVMIADLQAFSSGLGLSVIVEAPEQAAPAQSTAVPTPVADSASNAPDTSKGTPPKLTEANKTEILRLYDRGRGQSVNAMAKRFRVSRPTIEKVLQRAGIKN